MKRLMHPLLTENYTMILHEDDPKFGAPHHFEVYSTANKDRGKLSTVKVDFQEGPIKENGVNGIANEDALVMVLTRLEGFQNTPFKCEENAEAILHIEAALKAMRARTNKRVARNVEGTSVV